MPSRRRALLCDDGVPPTNALRRDLRMRGSAVPPARTHTHTHTDSVYTAAIPTLHWRETVAAVPEGAVLALRERRALRMYGEGSLHGCVHLDASLSFAFWAGIYVRCAENENEKKKRTVKVVETTFAL